MKLHFIGTGSIDASQRSACTLFNDNILIDVPNGIVKTIKAMGINILDIRTILITHLHGDHFFDLPFYMIEKYNSGDTRETKIYCPTGAEEKIRQLFDLGFPDFYNEVKDKTNINFYEIGKIKGEEIMENVYLTSLFVNHGRLKPVHGYIITSDNASVSFTGDSSFSDSIVELIDNSDVSVLDCSLPYVGNEMHMGLDDIVRLCQRYNDKMLIPTHMQDDTRELALMRPINNLFVPNDGDIVEIIENRIKVKKNINLLR